MISSTNDRPLPTTHIEWLERAREQEKRFRSKILKHGNGCHLWQCGKDKDGYGKFAITGRGPRKNNPVPVQKHVRSHKLIWELEFGPVSNGLVVRHTCDNPSCCNIEHLVIGTQSDNRRDCVTRGREPRGEQKSISKINNDKVLQIRKLSATGMNCCAVARATGVTRSIARSVLNGTTWRHVK